MKNNNSFFSNDFITYYWASLFIVPVLYLLNVEYMEVLIGCFVYIWVMIFIIYLLINRRVISNIDNVNFSKKSLYIFFGAVLFSFVYSTVSKYYAFYVPARDAAIFNSMMQQILLGNLGYSSVAGFYHFATHQNYILVLLLPIYAIFPSQVTLQIIGSFVIWFAGIMLYKISRNYLNQLLSLLAVVVFYSSPSNHFYFFRPELFFPLGIFLIYYAYLKNYNWKYVVLLSILFLSIKEDAPLYMPGFILLFALRRQYKLSTILTVITILVAIVNLEFVQPYFVVKGHQEAAQTLAYWAQWGSTNKEILVNILSHPEKVIALLFDNSSGFWYLYGYWLFLPLSNLFVLSTSIIPMLLFTTSDGPRHALLEYYPNALSAIALLGMLILTYRLSSKYSKIKKIIYACLLFLLLLHNILYVRTIDLLKLWGDDNVSSDDVKYAFLSSPLYHGRWQEFFYVNIQDNNDFNQMYNVLKVKYKNSNLCLENAMYPHFSDLDFSKIKSFIGENLNQENCVNVFSTVGDPWPNSPAKNMELIQQMLSTETCEKFGNFYYCDNLAK